MDLWYVWALSLIAVAALTWLLARSVFATRLTGLRVERDLLRERIVDLEASVSEDLETASMIAPVRDTLDRVERQVATLERDRSAQYGALEAMLGQVGRETAAVGAATATLAGALRSSNARGTWGEVQLVRVLEAAGLLNRCDLEEQVRAVSGHGDHVRPDVVVNLPGSRHLVIDAKAPMAAFLDAQGDTVTESERAALLNRHAEALAGHVASLARKEYWSAFTRTPEMVVAFVPNDAVLAAALTARPSLHEQALAARVVLVGPGALLALLRTVAFTWQQQVLSESAEELLGLGRDLYRRLGTLGEHTAKLGRSLGSSVEAYNAMVGALESRVLVTARKMQDLEVADGELPAPPPVETAPRPLGAVELIDAATAADQRPDLPDSQPGADGPPRRRAG